MAGTAIAVLKNLVRQRVRARSGSLIGYLSKVNARTNLHPAEPKHSAGWTAGEVSRFKMALAQCCAHIILVLSM